MTLSRSLDYVVVTRNRQHIPESHASYSPPSNIINHNALFVCSQVAYLLKQAFASQWSQAGDALDFLHLINYDRGRYVGKGVHSVGRLLRVILTRSVQKEGAIQYSEAIIMDMMFFTNSCAVS